MDLTMAVSRRRDESLVELTGVLDYACVPYLRQCVFELYDAGVHDVTVGVARVRLVDAAAIKVLQYLCHRAEQLGGRLSVSGASGVVLTTLEIAGVAKQLRVYDELDWPEAERDRVVADLAAPRPAGGQWPADVTERLGRLQAMDPHDPARAQAREAVIERCLPVARRLARRYGGSGEPVADLAQVASIGLIKAVDGFDAARGIEFGSYATPTIVGEIKRYFRDRTGSIRLPRRLQDLRLAVNRSRDELTQRLGRSPTVADIAAHVGVEEERVVEVLGAVQAYRPVSLDGAAAGGEHGTLLDVIGGEAPELGMVDDRESLRRLIGGLPRREQQILSMRFYGNLSQSQIADRVGLSQMHVSRLLRQTLDFLRRRMSQ